MLDAEQSFVVEGQSSPLHATIRNESVGPCFGAVGGPTIAGSVDVAGGSSGVTVTSVAMWLRSSGDVLPISSGLSSSGTVLPATCPGATPEGCTADIQEVVGNVEYPEGHDLVVQGGTNATLPFRFFPTLDAADLDLLDGAAAELVVVLHTTSAPLVTVAPVAFQSAPDASGVELEVSGPGHHSSTAIGSIPSADQVDVDAGTFSTDPSTPDQVTLVATATGSANGRQLRHSDSVVLRVSPDTTARPELTLRATPGVLEAGVPTEVVITARSTTEPVGPVVVTSVIDGDVGPTWNLLDAGEGADLTAGDNVASLAAVMTASSSVELTATTTGPAGSRTAEFDLEVLPAGTPTGPSAAPVTATIPDPDTGEDLIADSVTVRFADDAVLADVQHVAGQVGGVLAGRISSTSWQISVPTLANHAAFEALAATISALPKVIGVALDGAVDLDLVTPDDGRFGRQWHHETMRNTTTWGYNRGGGTVFVIDSGIDAEHQDLRARPGRNFSGAGADDFTGDVRCGHGTHVAGIIGAIGDNDRGVAGTSWGTRIVPVKVFRDNPPDDPRACSRAPGGSVAAAIQWSVDRGARVINLSLGGGGRNEDVVRALQDAWLNNVVVVAAAGNCGVSDRHYPAAYARSERFTSWLGTFPRTYTTDVIAVGSTDEDDDRSTGWGGGGCPDPDVAGSNFGDWVDLAAPGSEIHATFPVNGYADLSGTSMATPNVAGVVDLLVSAEPALLTEQVRERLISSGADIGDQQIGPRVDSYEATFNGSFEAGLAGWQRSGDVRWVRRVGPIRPREGSRMAWISSGPDSANTRGELRRTIQVDTARLDRDVLTVRFRYNYLSEEYHEYVGSQFNDVFRAIVRLPDGTEMEMATESVNTTAWTPVTGIDFPGGDDTVGQSGWRTARIDVPVAALGGNTTFLFEVFDVGDTIFDSVALIDDIELS